MQAFKYNTNIYHLKVSCLDFSIDRYFSNKPTEIDLEYFFTYSSNNFPREINVAYLDLYKKQPGVLLDKGWAHIEDDGKYYFFSLAPIEVQDISTG